MTEPTTVEGQGEAPWTGWVLISDDFGHEWCAGRVGQVIDWRTEWSGVLVYRVRVGTFDCIARHDEISKWQVQA